MKDQTKEYQWHLLWNFRWVSRVTPAAWGEDPECSVSQKRMYYTHLVSGQQQGVSDPAGGVSLGSPTQ